MNEQFKILTDWGFFELREIPGHGVCGLKKMICTTGLFINLKTDLISNPYDGRYCFKNDPDAIQSINKWDGMNDPPGDWIKYKGRITEYDNPKSTE